MASEGGLEIEQDTVFQEREWRLERLASPLLVVLMAAALVGVFGVGPVSWWGSTARDGVLAVDYDRFSRRGSATELHITIDAQAADDGEFQVEIARNYLDDLDITSISPEPDQVETVGDSLRYTFLQGDPEARLAAVFALTPDALWRSTGSARLPSGEQVEFWQFFYP